MNAYCWLHIKWCLISWGFRQAIDHALQNDTNIRPSEDKSRFSQVLQSLHFGNMSCVCWYRHWYAARLCFGSASGLLRLEELVRRFLISRETLSIRMLDDNLDPTPLLKEIRDDKVATIIIDANASVSYLILKKVSSQTSTHSSQSRPHVQDVKLLMYTVQHSNTQGFVFLFNVPIREIQVTVMRGMQSLPSVE